MDPNQQNQEAPQPMGVSSQPPMQPPVTPEQSTPVAPSSAAAPPAPQAAAPEATVPQSPQPQPAVEPVTAAAPVMQQPQPQPGQSFTGGAPVQSAALNTPQPAAPMSPSAFSSQSSSQKKLPIKLIAIIVSVLLLLGGGAFFAMRAMTGNIELKTYEGEDFSILYPSEGYEVEEMARGLEIREITDDRDTQSMIRVESYPATNLTDEEEDEFLTSLKETLTEESLTESLGEGAKAKHFSSEIREKDGKKVLFIEAVLAEKAGTEAIFSIRAFAEGDNIYMVMIGGHESDKGLIKSMDKIQDSFKVK